MSKNIEGKAMFNVSIPDDKRFEGKTDIQKNKLVEKIIRSVCRFGNLKITNVKIVLK